MLLPTPTPTGKNLTTIISRIKRPTSRFSIGRVTPVISPGLRRSNHKVITPNKVFVGVSKPKSRKTTSLNVSYDFHACSKIDIVVDTPK